MLLIVGSNGLLGRHAVRYFRTVGERVVCASHQPGADVLLDLREPPGDVGGRLPAGIMYALICSGITNLDACRQDPAGTRRFNVVHTIELLAHLLRRGIVPIFCSSDVVFQGDRGDYQEDDPRVPTTEYGRQKKAVEDFLLGQHASFLIIRMSKLYSLELDDPSPIGQMLNALGAGTPIRCAGDQVICPTWTGDIPRALDGLLRIKARGVYHVASPERYTRYTLGLRLASALRLEHLVQRCSIRDLTFSEPRPLDNSLNIQRFLVTTGMRLSTLVETLPKMFACRRMASLQATV